MGLAPDGLNSAESSVMVFVVSRLEYLLGCPQATLTYVGREEENNRHTKREQSVREVVLVHRVCHECV